MEEYILRTKMKDAVNPMNPVRTKKQIAMTREYPK